MPHDLSKNNQEVRLMTLTNLFFKHEHKPFLNQTITTKKLNNQHCELLCDMKTVA